ncbi:hypothetical protein TNCV_3488451 [Trichonephila clavipes]|nr:hypothetical protein TNCV_3488451 [Trichonephila clavipes]
MSNPEGHIKNEYHRNGSKLKKLFINFLYRMGPVDVMFCKLRKEILFFYGIYLDMLQIFAMPIMKEKMSRSYSFQHDVTPFHYPDDFTSYLNTEVPAWLGHGELIQWPP